MAESRQNQNHGKTWAIVLAAGEGSRLRELTTGHDGVSVPKQYCDFGTGKSLLRRTLERAGRFADAERVMTVVARDHWKWWERELADQAPRNVVVQPENRGTAAGVLLPLMELMRRDPRARVVILPSDHGVEDEDALAESFAHALSEAGRAEDEVVVLGITPEHADTSYGWIVPEKPTSLRTRRVGRFVEKPHAALAEQLMDEGGLWSSFLMAGSVGALIELYRRAVPWLLATFSANLEALGSASEERSPHHVIEDFYKILPTYDFSRDVLEKGASQLRVLSVPACGWSDLGTPDRLLRFLDRAQPARPEATPARARRNERPTTVRLAASAISL